MFERGRSEGPRLFGLYPNGLFTFGLFWTTGTCGLSLLDDYDVWTIAVWTILDYMDVQTTRTFGLSPYGLSPFGLFWTTGTFGLQGHLDYRCLDY